MFLFLIYKASFPSSCHSNVLCYSLYYTVVVHRHHHQMSEACASRCGIMRLVDKRFAGMAVGVGSAKILGRVHATDIRIGGQHLTSSFTVMEKHAGSQTEFLLGLDMLKKHQCCIDLKKGVLRLEVGTSSIEVPFLSEVNKTSLYWITSSLCNVTYCFLRKMLDTN